MSQDVFNRKRKYKRIRQRLENSSSKNKKKILEFIDYSLSCGISYGRLNKYIHSLTIVDELSNKKFEKIKRKEMEKIVRTMREVRYKQKYGKKRKLIIEGNEGKKYSKHSVCTHLSILKTFWKWMKGSKEHPKEVSWIKNKQPDNGLKPSDMLKKEDIEKMIKASTRLADKAKLMTLFESGCRVSEFLSLKLKNTETDKYGMKLSVDGKTGIRPVRLVWSVPYLCSYIDNHPRKEEKEAPLWITDATNKKYKQLGYAGLRKRLQDIAKEAGIKKPVNPHNFRHSRATFLASRVKESTLRKIMGWSKGSDMPSVYVHLSMRDVDSEVLKASGVEVSEKDEEEKELLPKKCPRCQKKNNNQASFCIRCGLPLDQKIALGVSELREAVDIIAEALINQDINKGKLIELIKNKKNKRDET